MFVAIFQQICQEKTRNNTSVTTDNFEKSMNIKMTTPSASRGNTGLWLLTAPQTGVHTNEC